MEKTTSRDHWAQLARENLNKANQGLSKNQTRGRIKRILEHSHHAFEFESYYLSEKKIDLLLKAAEANMICGKYKHAAESFEMAAASLYRTNHEAEAAALLYCEAGFCEEMICVGQGSENFKKAVSIYCDDGKYCQAARIQKWIAENHESNKNYLDAIEEFKLTCQYYKAAAMNEQVLFVECKIGHLFAILGKLDEASEMYYNIGLKQTSQNLLKYSAQKSFFNSCLLLLAKEMGTKDSVEKCMEMAKVADFRFGSCPAYQLLRNILGIIDDNSSSRAYEFAEHLHDYDQLFPFDEMEVHLLGQIYQNYFVHVNVNS